MMKTMVRLLVIIVVVLAVAGGMYWAGENLPILQGVSGEHGEGFAGERVRSGTGDGLELGEGRPQRGTRLAGGFSEREGHDEGAAAGWLGVLRNVVIFAVFVLAVLGLQRVFQIAKHYLRNRNQQPGAALN